MIRHGGGREKFSLCKHTHESRVNEIHVNSRVKFTIVEKLEDAHRRKSSKSKLKIIASFSFLLTAPVDLPMISLVCIFAL